MRVGESRNTTENTLRSKADIKDKLLRENETWSIKYNFIPMNPKLNLLFIASFALAMIVAVLGAILRLNHFVYPDILLLIGVLFSVVYIAIAIYEVNKSIRLSKNEKIMWTSGFIFFGTIIGIIYFFMGGRKRV